MIKPLSLTIIMCLFSSIFGAGGVMGAELVRHCVSNATELQNALNAASGNNAPDLIRVVQGTYNGHFPHSSSQGYGVTLRGGYTAGCAGRVIDPANTILDGGGSGIVVAIGNNEGGDVEIEGFTIRNGEGVGSGGGLIASSFSSTGRAGDVIITSNIVTGNRSGQNGAGIQAYSSGETGSGAVTITGNTVTDNDAVSDGGGIHAKSETGTGTAGTVTLTNNLVTGNSAGGGGGGINIFSHAFSGVSGAISIEGNTISGNAAGHDGGVRAVSYGTTGSSAITVRGNKVSDNTGDTVSGISATSNTSSGNAGAVTFNSNTVTGNSPGRAADVRSSSPSDQAGAVTCVNNIIAGNTSTTSIGGIYSFSYTNTGTAGAVTFANNTVTGNSATFTGGAYIESSDNNAYVYNNIMWGNTGQDVTVHVAAAYGFNNDYATMGGSWEGGSGGNIDRDPLFVGGSDYHLTTASPCIEAGLNSATGIPTTDFEGDDRIIDGNFDTVATVDMGADEYLCATAPVTISGTDHYYTTMQAAYTDAGDGDSLLAQALTFTGPLTLAGEIGITLKGGYSCGYTTIIGFTKISNSLTIGGSGSLAIENLIIM